MFDFFCIDRNKDETVSKNFNYPNEYRIHDKVVYVTDFDENKVVVENDYIFYKYNDKDKDTLQLLLPKLDYIRSIYLVKGEYYYVSGYYEPNNQEHKALMRILNFFNKLARNKNDTNLPLKDCGVYTDGTNTNFRFRLYDSTRIYNEKDEKVI